MKTKGKLNLSKMEFQIEKAAEIIKGGGIVIFPTDTAYGIGCRMDNEAAVSRLFTIRKRPQNQATPVLFSNIGEMKDYLPNIPEDVKEKLMDKYWPGGLTIVLPCNTKKVLKLVRGDSGNLGVRIPDNKITLSIISKAGIGILGPSANFSGEQTPYRFEDLNPKLVSLADYVVEGECKLREASTVIDCSVKPWKLIREGAAKLSL
jgi:L-threonylcarbamoyladenylate synthase